MNKNIVAKGCRGKPADSRFQIGSSSIVPEIHDTMKVTRVLGVLAIALSGVSCDADSSSNGIVGPCVHKYEDPIVHIQSITNRRTSQPVTAFRITKIRQEGNDQNLQFLKQIMSFNIEFRDSTLYCTTPCGFGTNPAMYAMSISAQGFRDTVILVDASYAIFEGGCPSRNAGGTRISFQLEPVSNIHSGAILP